MTEELSSRTRERTLVDEIALGLVECVECGDGKSSKLRLISSPNLR